MRVLTVVAALAMLTGAAWAQVVEEAVVTEPIEPTPAQIAKAKRETELRAAFDERYDVRGRSAMLVRSRLLEGNCPVMRVDWAKLANDNYGMRRLLREPNVVALLDAADDGIVVGDEVDAIVLDIPAGHAACAELLSTPGPDLLLTK